jgi:hypothetical protein
VARPPKTLQAHLKDGSFRARRHHRLLNGPFVGEKRLEALQRGYQDASTERERRGIALDFEHAARSGGIQAAAVGGSNGMTAFAPADFLAQYLVHTKGPAAGKPFKLEPWQGSFVDELYEVDERGQRVFKRAILGVPRGNGKSPLAAAIGLYELMTHTDEPGSDCNDGHCCGCVRLRQCCSGEIRGALTRSAAEPIRRDCALLSRSLRDGGGALSRTAEPPA